MSKSQSLLLDPHLFSEEQQRASTSSSTLPDGPTARPDDDEGGFMGRIGARGIGAMTGAFTTSLLMTPFDVLRTRLQTRRPAAASPSPTTCCSRTLHSQSIPQSSTRLPSAVFCSTADLPRSTVSVPSVGGSAALRISGVELPDGCRKPARWQETVGEWRSAMKGTRSSVGGFSREIASVWHENGIRGYWKGVGTAISMGVPSAALYMLGYDQLRLHITSSPSISSSPTLVGFTPLFAGALARCFSATIVSPLELFRTRLQALPDTARGELPSTVPSTFRALRQLVRQEGVLSLWRGLGATLLRDVPFSGLYWFGYETLKNKVLVGPSWEKERQEGKLSVADGLRQGEWARSMVAGASSGALAALATHPFDLLKTRRQVFTSFTSSSAAAKVPNSTLGLLVHVIRSEGPQVLFAGLTPRLAKVAPSCALMISSYEVVGNFLSGGQI